MTAARHAGPAAFQQVQYCVALPVQLLVLVGLLYRNVGWAGPASLLVTLVGLPLRAWRGTH